MKTMRKLLALALALTMVLAMATAASAEVTTTGTVTIKDAAAGETYAFYRIYDLDSVGADGTPIYKTNTTWGDFGKGAYVTITEDGFVSGMEAFDTAAAQEFAVAVKNKNMAADETIVANASGDLAVDELKFGYYVMTTTRVNEKETQYTVFTLAKETGKEIKEKNTGLPTLTKTVEEDSDNEWYETNDADIGQDINFKVKVVAAAGEDKYTITDTLSGMKLDATSVKVEKNTKDGTSVLTAETDYILNATENSFTIELADSVRKSLADRDEIVVTYSAALTGSAKIAQGNENKAVLKYDGSKTLDDTTATFTYLIDVIKQDADTKAKLEGATFVLKNEDGKYYSYNEANGVVWVGTEDEATSATTDADGKLTFKGLDSATYTLVETKAPAGYVLKADGTVVTIDKANGSAEITNTKGDELPETGGMGTTLFYVVGGMMVCAAAVLLVTKKRMSAE